MNSRMSFSTYSRFREVFLNETGNWISSAPNFPSPANASKPSRASASSSSLGLIDAAEVGSITARGL